MRADPTKLADAARRLLAGESRQQVRRDLYSSRHFVEQEAVERKPAKVVPLPLCYYVGDELTSETCLKRGLSPLRRWTYCDHPNKPLGEVVCTCQGCGPRCPGYRPDSSDEITNQPPIPATAGIVFGCYGWPRLAELQVRLARDLCGRDTPILVADDGSGARADFETICDKLGVDFVTNPQRLGHYAGDLSVFCRGVEWAAARRLATIVKVSQRLLILRKNWLSEVAAIVENGPAETVLPRLSEGTDAGLYFRTEAVAMRVADWVKILHRLRDQHLGNPTELRIHDIVQRNFAGRCLHWTLFPNNRYVGSPELIWHCTNPSRDYYALAKRYGVELDNGFYTAGHNSMPGWLRG